MSKPISAKHQELVTKLREIFQIDRPELYFGIYRILNARATEINDYLQNRLADKVKQVLSDGSAANEQSLQTELDDAIKQAQALGANPDDLPKVKDLRAKLREVSAGSNEHENAVFSHLLTFFSRYYDNGDFISQRRYKGDTYAIPYSGEEVMLHWANKDQYYTKSGENFANYSFKLPGQDGKPDRTVHLRLVAADTAKDNRKDNDKDRRYVLVEPRTVTRLDEQGEEFEEKLLPVEEIDGASPGADKELLIRFEYKAVPKGSKQDALVEKAVQAILGDATVKARWLDFSNRAPTEKNPQRTLLEKYLSDYTTKNTADYFIHKDLGGFLRRELDFYIKNEVMHLDDVQNANAFADIEKSLRMIQCLRSIAQELIIFLAQLEDFQKKLWLKKKFVVSSHYCITLNMVPDRLWPQIARNEKQWEQWRSLGLWEFESVGTESDLIKNPFLMVDTSLFDNELKSEIVNSIDEIDNRISGRLFHSDNFQALNLLTQSIKGRVDCFYLDPPYNTESNPIIYKNSYKHSSWLSLMRSRLIISRQLERNDSGVHVLAIDAAEKDRLFLLMEELFPDRHCETVSVIHNPGGTIGKNFSATGEYAMFLFDDSKEILAKEVRDDDPDVRDLMNTAKGASGNYLRSTGKTCFYPVFVKGDEIIGFGDVCADDFHPPRNLSRQDGVIEVYPIDGDGIERKWVLGRATVESCKSELFVKRDRRSGETRIERRKTRINFKTVWTDGKYSAKKYGTEWLGNILPVTKSLERIYPKSINLVKDCIFAAVGDRPDALIVDYFAGSGTTGEAVILLNRGDGGSRKYYLIEQGEYFESITKPRILKSVYSTGWSNGKPLNQETGISHILQVLKLESYEDTLNNLQLRKPEGSGDLFGTLPQTAQDDYLMRYMLDVESRGSLLSVEDFKKPFDYALNIAADSAGAFDSRKVDMVETFNYLIGLRVKNINAQPDRGFVSVTGTLPSGEQTLVLWRDCDKIDYEELRRMANRLDLEAANNPYDMIYINGDHNIPASYTPTAGEEVAGWMQKIRQIEPEFLERMFSVEDI
jgi:adenine-specific DNA-methyltransferase